MVLLADLPKPEFYHLIFSSNIDLEYKDFLKSSKEILLMLKKSNLEYLLLFPKYHCVSLATGSPGFEWKYIYWLCDTGGVTQPPITFSDSIPGK